MFTKVFKNPAVKNLLYLGFCLVLGFGLNFQVFLLVVSQTEYANDHAFLDIQKSYTESNFAEFIDTQTTSANNLITYYDYENIQIREAEEELANTNNIETEKQKKKEEVSNPETSLKKINEAATKLEITEEILAKGEDKTIKPGDKILLVGDSIIKEQTGIVFERGLKNMGFNVVREGVYSTGLTNTAYYNWASRVEELNNLHNPDAIVVYMGANDGQKIYSETDGFYYNVSNQNWQLEYEKNVREFLEKAVIAESKVYLMGHSVASTADFTNKFKKVNSAFSLVSDEFENVEYVDIRDRFSPDGRYNRVIPFNGKRLYVKYADGVHFTKHGSEIAFDELQKAMADELEK